MLGCLPTLATIPVWIGLYRALSNVADEVATLVHLLLVTTCFSLFTSQALLSLIKLFLLNIRDFLQKAFSGYPPCRAQQQLQLDKVAVESLGFFPLS